MLGCRSCRIPIAAPGGCVICSDIKGHLINTDEDEETKPSLSDVSSEVVVMLRQLLRAAKGKLKDKPDDFAAAQMVLKVGNTSSKVLEAARKLQTDGLAAIRNMSFLERAELFIGWYANLPPPYRMQVQKQMDKFEADTAKALPEAT